MNDLLSGAKECIPLSLTEAQIELIRGAEQCDNSRSIGLGVGLSLGTLFLMSAFFVGGYRVSVRGSQLESTTAAAPNRSRLSNLVDLSVCVVVVPVLAILFLTLPWRFIFFCIALHRKPPKAPIDVTAEAMFHLILFSVDFLTAFSLVCWPLLFPIYYTIKLWDPSMDPIRGFYFHKLFWKACCYGVRDFALFFIVAPLTLLSPWRTVFAIFDLILQSGGYGHFYPVLQHFLLGIMDILTLPALVLDLCAFWRWPAICSQIFEVQKKQVSFFCIVPKDIETCSWATYVRTSLQLHWVLWAHAVMVPLDYLTLAFSSLTLLLPYRAVLAISTAMDWKLQALERMTVGVAAVLLTFLDALTIVPAVCVFASMYRLPAAVSSIRSKPHLPFLIKYATYDWQKTLWSVRFHVTVWFHFIHLLIDLVVFLPMLGGLLFFGPHRLVVWIVDTTRAGSSWSQMERRKYLALQVALLLLDVAVIVPLLILLITIYRIPSLIGDGKRRLTAWQIFPGGLVNGVALRSKDSFGRWGAIMRSTSLGQIAVLFQFGSFCGDTLSLLFAPIAMALPWRTVSTISNLAGTTALNQRRMAILISLILSILDILTLPLLVVIFLTVYRAPLLIRRWRKVASTRVSLASWGSALRTPEEDESFFILSHSLLSHVKVLHTFGEILLDVVPTIFFFLSIIAPWRFCLAGFGLSFAAQINSPRRLTSNRRRVASTQFCLALFDLIQLPVILAALVPLYRIPQIFRKIKELGQRKTGGCGFRDDGGLRVAPESLNPYVSALYRFEIYQIFWQHAALLIADLGAIAMLCLCFFAPWRVVLAFIGLLRAIRENKPVSAIYETVGLQLVLGVGDIFVLPLLVVQVVNPYRLVQTVKNVFKLSAEAANFAEVRCRVRPLPLLTLARLCRPMLGTLSLLNQLFSCYWISSPLFLRS